MKNYKYVARDSTGLRREGLAQAISSNDVLNWLHQQGFTPVSVDEIYQHVRRSRRVGRRRRIKSADLAALCWQLTTMLGGGIPITAALDTIGEDLEHLHFQNILMQVSEKVKKGQPFSEAVSEYPNVFNRLSCAIILAGETSGNLADALHRLAVYYDNRDKLAKKIKGAMAYPVFILIFIILIVIFIMTFIVPRFRTIFKQIGGELPAFTRGFMAFYELLANNLIFFIGGLVFLIVFNILMSKTKKGHYFFSKLVLKLPLFGKVIAQAFVTTFCRTMANLLAAGVSVLEVFDVLSEMTNNDIIKGAIVRAREIIVAGSNIYLAMEAVGFFPNMVVKMTQVGEESGSLSEVLDTTGNYYERKVESMITTMMALLEPIMIIAIGAIVLVVVLALYLPIFSMSDIKA